jgi:lactoylglutathione lyase
MPTTPQETRLVLTVKDLEAATRFFRDQLGMTQLAEFHDHGGNGVLLGGGRATLELFDEAQAAAIDAIEVGRRVAGRLRLGFRVDDSAAVARTLAEGGAEVIGGPVETPWGDRNVRLVGPEAIQLTLFS